MFLLLICLLAGTTSMVHCEDPYFYFTWHVTYGTISPAGVPQQVILINNEFPGPNINSTSNNNLVVNVFNELDEPLLFHWYCNIYCHKLINLQHCMISSSIYWIFDWLAGREYNKGRTHGKMGYQEQTVQSYQEQTTHTVSKWRIRLEATSTTPVWECTVQLVVLVASGLTVGY